MLRPLIVALALTATATAAETIALGAIPDQGLRERIAALPAAGRTAALERLTRQPQLLAEAPHLGVSHGGRFYFTNCGRPSAAALAAPAPSAAAPGVVVRAAVPIADVPVYNSRTGSTRTIYLDFNGETIAGTDWNTSQNVASWAATAFSMDGDLANFSDTEQAAINLIWQRVAEDYRVFDVNVTTVRPATMGANVSHVLITRSTDANNILCPAGNVAGGVAYLDGFGDASAAPAWVYFDNLAQNNIAREDWVAECASHEAGHNMNLRHDGNATEEYYAGQGSPLSWAPIMGVGYDKIVTQWCRGEYTGANNTQDDIAILSAHLGTVVDVADGDLETFTTLTSGTGGARALTPFTGIMNTANDSDTYAFTSAGGAVSFTVRPRTVSDPTGQLVPSTSGVNLDVQIDLLDESNAVILTASPFDDVNATISGTLPSAGDYRLRVRPAGNRDAASTGFSTYASLGSYTVTGTIPPPAPGSLGFATMSSEQFEGSAGARTITLDISRSPRSGGAISVHYATSNMAATTADGDYTAATGDLLWADGDPLTKSITLTVNGDTTEEPHESFLVTLSAPTGGATLNSSTTHLVVLRNDDGPSAALVGSSAGQIQEHGTGDSGGCGAGALAGLVTLGGFGLLRRRRR